MNTQLVEIAGLAARIVGRDDAALTAILLHGFGAPGDDLVDLAQYLAAPARFVFPAAPITLPGVYGEGRAWWPLDLAKLDAQLRSGKRDFSEIPDGLADARAKLTQLVDHYAGKPVVLGGFSQGAMLALDVALHRASPLAGVVQLSGTLIAEPEWTPLLPRMAGVPVFMAHGRRDPLLPFAIAELLRDRLIAAGANVEWHAFDGGHEIPQRVLDALGTFLSVVIK